MAEKILMLALSPTMEKGTIHKWHVNEGDAISSGDILCEVETDKTTMEYESINEGTILKILVPPGGRAAVGEPIAIVGEKGENIEELLKAPLPVKKEPVKEKKVEALSNGRFFPGDRLIISPLAARMAHEKGINPAVLKGSGPGGRIIKRDLLDFLSRENVESTGETPAYIKEYREPLSVKRQVIAARLTQAKTSAPHYYLKVEAIMDGLLAVREELNRGRKQRLSFNAFLLKLAAEALKQHPALNSTFDGEFVSRRRSSDIALAVAQEDGLITPVVRNCGNKGIIEINEELFTLVKRARENRLNPDEYNNSSFTITNLGSYGIDEFTAIINQPALAILAVGQVKKAPIVNDDGELEIRSIVKLTLSCDHRVIDGAVGAAFLKGLKEIIENPMKALL